MFKCKACQAKDSHIKDLNNRIDKFEALLEKVIAPTYAPAIIKQADIALGGAGTEQEPEISKELSEVEKQAIALLTGNY